MRVAVRASYTQLMFNATNALSTGRYYFAILEIAFLDFANKISKARKVAKVLSKIFHFLLTLITKSNTIIKTLEWKKRKFLNCTKSFDTCYMQLHRNYYLINLELIFISRNYEPRRAAFISVTRKLTSRPRSNAHCTRVTLNHSVGPPK